MTERPDLLHDVPTLLCESHALTFFAINIDFLVAKPRWLFLSTEKPSASWRSQPQRPKVSTHRDLIQESISRTSSEAYPGRIKIAISPGYSEQNKASASPCPGERDVFISFLILINE
jgi:hypothetical protein